MLRSFWLVTLQLLSPYLSLPIISNVVDPMTFHPVDLYSKVLLGSFLGQAVGNMHGCLAGKGMPGEGGTKRS